MPKLNSDVRKTSLTKDASPPETGACHMTQSADLPANSPGARTTHSTSTNTANGPCSLGRNFSLMNSLLSLSHSAVSFVANIFLHLSGCKLDRGCNSLIRWTVRILISHFLVYSTNHVIKRVCNYYCLRIFNFWCAVAGIECCFFFLNYSNQQSNWRHFFFKEWFITKQVMWERNS